MPPFFFFFKCWEIALGSSKKVQVLMHACSSCMQTRKFQAIGYIIASIISNALFIDSTYKERRTNMFTLLLLFLFFFFFLNKKRKEVRSRMWSFSDGPPILIRKYPTHDTYYFFSLSNALYLINYILFGDLILNNNYPPTYLRASRPTLSFNIYLFEVYARHGQESSEKYK